MDIDGDLRIRTVTEDSTLKRVLVIDSTDHNRVHWIDLDDLVGGNPDANNGLSIDPNDPNMVQLGQLYSGIPAYNGLAELLNDREIPMNDFNIHFTGFGTQGANRISVGKPVQPGYDAGKLSLWNQEEVNGIFALTDRNNVMSSNYAAIKGQIVNFTGENNFAIRGLAENTDDPYALGVGVEGTAFGSGVNIGIQAISGGNPSAISNYGGIFQVSGPSTINKGIQVASSGGATGETYGVDVTAHSYNSANTYGIKTYATCQTVSLFGNNVYALYAETPNLNNNWAGYFNGNVHVTGSLTWGSDQMFKSNIDTIQNSLSIIKSILPKTFYYDTATFGQMNFSDKKQYGFIAQQVDSILPELVLDATFPAQYDSLGNQTSAAIQYKALNYNAFIAILMSGMQQQQDSIEQMAEQIDDQRAINAVQDSTISSLNDRLTQLEECLSGILPILCKINQSAIQQTPEETRSQLVQEIQVTLSDEANIVLNQNVPNPFAERTVISYSIPETVGTAQIIFYNAQGKLIKTVDIQERGEGRINVYANDLSTGIYTYSLVVDGRIAATKKMMKQ